MTSPPPFTPDVEAAGRILAETLKRLYYWRVWILSEATYDGTGQLVYHRPEAMR